MRPWTLASAPSSALLAVASHVPYDEFDRRGPRQGRVTLPDLAREPAVLGELDSDAPVRNMKLSPDGRLPSG